MLKLKLLKFKGIGRFVEEQTIRFDELGKLVQIDGNNKNTGGSSGSGKTTIFKAHDYLLGLNDIPANLLQSRLTEESIWVSGYYDWDGSDICISRSKSKGLVIDFPNGLTISGNNKLTEEKLDEIIGMPRHLFRKMLHKRQKEGGFFLQFTPKETHEFLTDILGLNSFRNKLLKIDTRLKELLEQKNNLNNDCIRAKAALEATQDAIKSLGEPPIQDVHQEVVMALKDKADESANNFRTMQMKYGAEIGLMELKKPKMHTVGYVNGDLTRLENELAQVRNCIESIKSRESERQKQVNSIITNYRLEIKDLENDVYSGLQAHTDIEKISQHIKLIQSHTCPTCEQEWLTENAHKKEKALLQNIKELRDRILLGESSSRKIQEINNFIELAIFESSPQIPKELDDMLALEQKLKSKIKEEQDRYSETIREHQKQYEIQNEQFWKEHKALKLRLDAELESCRGQMSIDQKIFENALSRLRAYNESKKRYDASISQLVQSERSYGESHTAISEALLLVDQKINICEDSQRAIKSYMSYMFEDALEHISGLATNIIRNIPNMANATIQLDSTRETQSGKVKEEVNAVLSMDGEIGVPIKSLSGGEGSAVDLAVDLAVIDLIESETGKGIDLFILDEPFQGLSAVEIEMALEIIKNSNLNKKIVLVEHNPEVKQMVESRLTVVREGLVSHIETGAA